MPRNRRLLEREAEELVPLLVHPVQADAETLISYLITQLRTIEDHEGMYEFQRELFGHLHAVEEARSKAKRHAQLARKGKTVGTSDTGLPWALEGAMWTRIARQLRSVGDAMAWRLLGYNRRAIMALSRNDAAGPMYGKAGLGHELGAVVDAWNDDQEFALLHDLTNCLRIGDLTYFTSEGPRVSEVKSQQPSGSRARAQLRRAQEAIEVANGHGLLGGTIRIVDTRRPLVTSLDEVAAVLDAAVQQGIVAKPIGDRQAVHAFTVDAARGDMSGTEIETAIQRLTDDAFWLAGLRTPGQHHLQGHRLDLLDKGPHNAPYTIFPFAAEISAALTTDRMSYRHTVAYDRIADRFEQHGMHVTCLLPTDTTELGADLARVVDPVSGNQARLDVGMLDRLLYEFIDVDLLVDTVTEQIRGEVTVGESVLTVFPNEADVWT